MKQWFFGLYASDEKGQRHNKIVKFANKNKLAAGEIVVLGDYLEVDMTSFMYFAESEFDLLDLSE